MINKTSRNTGVDTAANVIASLISAGVAALVVGLADGPTWAWLATALIIYMVAANG